MADGRNRPAPPRVRMQAKPKPPYYITHKTQVVMILGGVILVLLFVVDVLAAILVKFI